MKHIISLSESPCYGCEMEKACRAKIERDTRLQDVMLKSWVDAEKKKEDCIMYIVLKMEENNATTSR